jgi:hypothetical protein
MKTCVIYGKGPTFKIPLDIAEMYLAINEAGWHMDHVDAVVAWDQAAALRMLPWCGLKRIKLITNKALELQDDCVWPMNQLPKNEAWERLDREHAMFARMAYTEGYSSTVAGWMAWLCGCTRIVTYGLGGTGYHPLFEGQPGNPQQGEKALEIMQRLCEVKGMELEVR